MSKKIELSGNPSTTVIKIGKQRLRTLLDTGAEVSLISYRIFKTFPKTPKLKKETMTLQTVGSTPLRVIGSVELPFQMRQLTLCHRFYIVDGMNRNCILGLDWLRQNGVRMYFDLSCMRIGKTYIPLEEDVHIASILRITQKTVLKPQTATICNVKLSRSFEMPNSRLLDISPEISDEEIPCINNEPGVALKGSVSEVRNPQKVPVLLVNQTNRTMNLRRGSVVGKARPLELQDISSVAMGDNGIIKEDFQDVDVPDEYRAETLRLLRRNSDLFAKKDTQLGHTDTVRMNIDTKDHKPIRNRPYRTPLQKRQVINNAIDEMLEAKVIERSRSPWSFGLVVVDKKDGTKRMCIDFRSLNKIVTPMSVPLPLIDDILTLLGQSKYFTTLDLKSGYWQVELDEESKPKTAFACHRGLFQFNRMPFGLSNAPAVFQELMNIVLQECEQFATAYLDDVLIYSKTPQEHLQHVQIVFRKLREHGLKLKLKKCSFFKKETEYLGFIITDEGVKPDNKKVEAIRTLPPPTCVREIRGFIGMCSYYRRFIPNFSKIAEPLTELTKKYARFKWTEDCQKAFDFLKDSLTVVPLLAYPDPTQPYVLYTDASDSSIGSCLTQKTKDGEEMPLYYLSHKLSPTQRRWSVIEKEAFAIVYSLQKLDHYLHNSAFVIRTDHRPLSYIFADKRTLNKKLSLWSLTVAAYNCKVEYIEGRYNCCADLLSRLPTDASEEPQETQETQEEAQDILDVDDRALEIGTLNSNRFRPKDYASCEVNEPDDIVKPQMDLPQDINIIQEQENDQDIVQLRARLSNGKATKTEEGRYLVIDNTLYYLSNADSDDPNLRLYIPKTMEGMVISQHHEFLGHMAVDKTYDTMRKKYYFPMMYKQIHQHVDQCVTCQTRSHSNPKPPLQDTEIPPYPFAKIALDLSGPYPETLSGNKYIVSFIDVYSGWPEAFPVPDKSAANIVHLILEEIFPRYGSSLSLVTDNGSENIAKSVQETLEALNIHHITTSYYSPQANGKVERFHRTMVDVMAKKIKESVNTWDLFLNQTLAAVRFHTSEVTKASPFFLLYNRDVVLPLDTILKPRRRYAGEDIHKIALEQQHKSFVLIHRYLKQAKKKQKRLADRNSKDEHLKVGDPVYVRNHRRTSKLDNKWTPYYRIIEQTGPVSFKVRNQLTGEVTKAHARHLRLANVDEWSLPKDNIGRPLRKSTYVVPPEESSSDESEMEPALQRVIKRTRRERSDSEDEDDIPLTELRQRLRTRELSKNQIVDSDDDIPLAQLRSNEHLDTQTDDKEPTDDGTESEIGSVADEMEIDAVKRLEIETARQYSETVPQKEYREVGTDCLVPNVKQNKTPRQPKQKAPKEPDQSKDMMKKLLKVCLEGIL